MKNTQEAAVRQSGSCAGRGAEAGARALRVLAAASALALLAACSGATQMEDAKYDATWAKRLEELGRTYETLETAKVAGMYSQDTFAHAFNLPRNWDTSGEERVQTLESRLSRLSAVKWEMTDDVRTWKRGKRWFTLQGIRVTETLKDGRVAEFEGQHSALSDERDGKWQIVHEHFGGTRDRMASTFKVTPDQPVASGPPPAEPFAPAPGTDPSAPPAPPIDTSASADTGLKDIFYDFDRAEVRPDGRAAIEWNVAWMKRHPNAKVVIEGHCDERGTRAYNMALGSRRAESARAAMVQAGADPDRLETVSFGKERPFEPGHDESAWAKNRRAHFVEKRR